MNVTNVVKPLHVTVIYKVMQVPIQVRNPINVTIVVKVLHVRLIFKDIKEYILVRSPMNVTSVVKFLHVSVHLDVMRKNTAKKTCKM